MLNWAEFEKLPGSQQLNFELLWRAAVQAHYGANGEFRALANQPGVEFHLRLTSQCALGNPGRWYGWQCKWYGIPSGKALGKTRRDAIVASLRKSKAAIPGLTDWILCTRHPLTAADQKWFYKLDKKITLHLKTVVELEQLLTGPAEIYRRTYFGELILTPERLKGLHEESTSRINKRWLPDAHQVVQAERDLRRMLGEASSWAPIKGCARRLSLEAAPVNRDLTTMPKSLKPAAQGFLKTVGAFTTSFDAVYVALTKGDLTAMREALTSAPTDKTAVQASTLPRKLRAARRLSGMYATNALATMRRGAALLAQVDEVISKRLVGVVADAGGGKTQLAAQLTSETAQRPAGLLLHGRDLHKGKNLDDLARSVKIGGLPVPSMEALLAALDAAGQRARHRLPLVIDGLNECEDPRDWKQLLASLDVVLKRFPEVLVVCTLRTGARNPSMPLWASRSQEHAAARNSFVNDALPDAVEQIEMSGFGGDAREAVRRYFDYYRIHPGDAEINSDLLSHPLTLRLYCEVANPTRSKDVGAEALPKSLTGLFDKYLEYAAESISEKSPHTRRYYPQDVTRALGVFGSLLWERNARQVPEDVLRAAMGDADRPWNESLLHMLEQEGVVLRIPGVTSGNPDVIPLYDALGGHLIARTQLAKHGSSGMESWLKDSNTLSLLDGGTQASHPMATDVFEALVGQVPRAQYGKQLWQLLDEPMRSPALQLAATLEGAQLDAETVAAIADHIREGRKGTSRILTRLYYCRATEGHPLNADFLHSVLARMSVAKRDLVWTEWVRASKDAFRRNAANLEESWTRTTTGRTAPDRLRALFTAWCLTTTVRALRDQVTRTLYWFGRGDPKQLFELAITMSQINDPYVFERVLAASYGVATALQNDVEHPEFATTTLPAYARKVYDLMFMDNAAARTTHVLARDYASRLVELGALHNRRLFSAKEIKRSKPRYDSGGRIEWQEMDLGREEFHSVDSPFRMDFENYTIGRLVPDRSNYDFSNPTYRGIRGKILWRVHDLGWSPALFGEVDKKIANEDRSGRMGNSPGKVDRYGKKYSLIAYNEMAGWLDDRGESRDDFTTERWTFVDIDPTYPARPRQARAFGKDFLGKRGVNAEAWMAQGATPNLKPYLQQKSVGGLKGPWVMLDGHVSQSDEGRGHAMFAFVRSFLVPKGDAETLFKLLKMKQSYGRLPEKPNLYGVYSGEIPWCSSYLDFGPQDFRFVIGERTIKVKEKDVAYYLDGKLTDFTVADVLRHQLAGVLPYGKEASSVKPEDIARLERKDYEVEIERKVDIEEVHQVHIPVNDVSMDWQDYEGRRVGGPALSKSIARACNLINVPRTYDLQTMAGDRVTLEVSYDEENRRCSEDAMFIKKDVLTRYLRRRKLSLVWVIWGERDPSYLQVQRIMQLADRGKLVRGDFKSVYKL